MTIKPLINQKPGKEENHNAHQDEQTQNLVVSNSPQREKRANVFDENVGRHRRTPQKNCSRLKRDHHKRDVVRGVVSDRDNKSPLFQVVVTTTGCQSAATNSSTNTNLSVKQDDSISGYNSGDEHSEKRDATLTPDEWKERDDMFIKSMSERGLIVKEIAEDGACLFRAISLQIYGDQDMHEDIRQQTMDYIYQNREYFAQFVTEDITSYVSRKRDNHAHGNHIEIQAMSEIYNRPVELYCYQTKPINIFNSEQFDNGYEPLRLSYQRCSHYNAILDPYKASVGVGLGLAGYKPDEIDHKQLRDAVRLSEDLEIEQTMFEDKLKTTDWEATNEAIEEQIARESYLQWCREKAQKSSTGSSSSTVTSTEVSSNPGNSCNSSSSSNNINSNLNDNSTITSGIPSSNYLETDKDGQCSSYCGGFSGTGGCSSKSPSGEIDPNNLTTDEGITYSRRSILTYNTQHRQRRRRRYRSADSNNAGERKANMVYLEKRSTDSNDSDIDGYTPPRKSKRRQPPSSIENLKTMKLLNTVIEETPGPSNSSANGNFIEKPISLFYQSLLESSYSDDGYGQMSEQEMIQKAIHMSRVDFIKKKQKHSDVEFYDSP